MLCFADVAAALANRQLAPDALRPFESVPIESVVVDSRKAQAGSLFVALRGEHHDGHNFIAQALGQGAVAVLAERPPEGAACQVCTAGDLAAGGCDPSMPTCLLVPDSLQALQQLAAYWRRRHSVRVVGITGSLGKTTSKELTAAVLSQRFRTLKSEGNYNNEIGLPLTLLRLEPSCELVVLEMGMYGLGEIARLAEIALPHVGVVTNVGPSHLERLASIERIAQAKAELVQALPAAEQGGVAILNADDDRVREMSHQTRARTFTYGLGPEADLWADDIESEGLEGIHFRLHYGQEAIHARVPMLGRHSVHTALSAAAVGLVEGLAWSEIVAGLSDQQAQLRLMAVAGPHGATILDDTYNASPASSIAALNLLSELNGYKIAVLGDMYELGSYEAEGHKLVGRRAREVTDMLVTVGPLGRIIGQEAIAAGMPVEAVHMLENNVQAAEVLERMIGAGHIVLVKGSRGMRMEEIVMALTRATAPAEIQAKES